MSKAVLVKSFSEPFPANIEVVTRPVPTPSAEELLIKVTCRPVNPSDYFSVLGAYPGFQPAQLPAVPGLEGCGVIQDNNGNTKFQNGQRVIVLFDGAGGNGSWQEHVCVREESLIPIPDSMPDEVACQFLVNPVTILGMLHELNAPEGAYILQTAAASTLGRMFITVAKLKGLKTINIVRRDEHVAALKELGGDVVINSENLKAGELKEAIKAEIGDNVVWAAIDCVGGPFLAEITNSLRDNGVVFLYAPLAGPIAHVNVIDLLFRGVVARGFWLSTFLASVDAAVRNQVFAETLELMTAGHMLPHNWKSVPLEDAVQAINDSNLPGKPGKVLLSSPV